jgi:radical SAM protein with 4Fe4S-binding SPASM domain
MTSSESGRASLLTRNPACSWRCLPVGYVVQDRETGRAVVLDALGSALFEQVRRPMTRAEAIAGFREEPEAERVLGRLLADGVLTAEPVRLLPREHPVSGKMLPAGTLTRAYQRASLPYAAGIEWTRGSRPCPPSREWMQRAGVGLSTGTWVRVLEQIAETGALRLLIAGVDPLLRSDALFLLQVARDAGFSVTLFAEGETISEEVADALARLSLDAIWLSLYGSDARGHDSHTKTPGSFARSIAAVHALVARGQPVRINGFPRSSRRQDRESLIETAESLECPFAIDPLLATEDSADPFHPAAMEVHEEPELPSARRPAIFVASNGTVSPCRAHPLNVGSALDHSVSQLWEESSDLRSASLLPLRPRAGCRECAIRNSCFKERITV